MWKAFVICLFAALCFCSATASAGVFISDGDINDQLQYRNFQITPDNFVTGTIVNASQQTVSACVLEVWSTNVHETQIFWRAKIPLSALPPGGKVPVKLPYATGTDTDLRIKFSFRIQGAPITR